MSAGIWIAWSLLPLTVGQTDVESTSEVPKAAAESLKAYAAEVVADTEARCGPGGHYYATSRLQRGDRVEVYREQAGYLAIRPPRGSYSWVPARQLQMTATDHVAVAREEGVRVYVGTELQQLNKHHWQVELRKGEAVEIRGEKQLVTPAGVVADRWYKVAPPAGEFRWLPKSAVRRDDGRTLPVEPKPLAGAGPATPLAEPPEVERIADAEPGAPVSPRVLTDSDASPVKAAPNPQWLSWESPSDPAEFERVLEQFSTRLAATVARPAEQWELDELRIKAGKMSEQGPSPLQRGKARKLLANVQEFQSLQSRLSGEAESPAGGDDGTPAADYAGQGWLMPVQSKNPSVPPFVVVDDNGRFLQFVSPAPGLNLRRYEKTKVGLIGPASYIPALDMPHVTAQRVVKLR